ncbi:uncharacterized protein LOC135496610 [Lineus longissimus]|uniref:uncharacterized protein LOC135496610 n=1 Tax=Lineus longissimus TaxID=88925 RepID=UPI00315D57E7
MSNDTPPSAGVASSATTTAPAKSSRITVFPTQAFNVNPTLLDHFNHAEVMTIPDILKTPEKRKVRLSIDGTVTQVSPVQSNKNWRRRDITISQDSQSVRCKLWNEKVDIIQEQHLNKRLKIENLETEHYNQSVSCRNTPETALETPDEECQKTFTIIAVNTSTKEMLVTMDGEDQSLTYTDAVITDDEDLPTPMQVTGTIKGQELVYLDV